MARVALLALLSFGCSLDGALRPGGPLDAAVAGDCPAGTLECGGLCLDPQTDVDHCGDCGTACGPGADCLASACTCRPGWLRCGAACVQPSVDAGHCGGCGVRCDPPMECRAGACAPPRSAWRMLGADPQHSGVARNETGGPPTDTMWQEDLGSGNLCPAVSENGWVFITSAGCRFPRGGRCVAVAFDVEGGRLWTHEFDGPFAGCPSVVDGRVFVSEANGPGRSNLWGFDARTGAVLFQTLFTAPQASDWPPLVVDGSVFVPGGKNGGVCGFDALTGVQRFSTPLDPYLFWSPAWFKGGLFTFLGGALRAHDPASGKALWTVSVPWDDPGIGLVLSAPVFGDALAYVVGRPSLYAIDPTTHTVAFEVPGNVSVQPAVEGGVLYAVNDGALEVRDATSGAALWRFAPAEPIAYPPAIAGGLVYVSTMHRSTYAVDRTTHTAVWSGPLGGWPTVAAGHLFIAGSEGMLSVIALQ